MSRNLIHRDDYVKNDQMNDNQICLLNFTRTLSVHSSKQALRVGTYQMSIVTMNGWSAQLGMPLYPSFFYISFPQIALCSVCSLSLPFMTPISHITFDLGCRAYVPHTPTTLLPSPFGKDRSNRLYVVTCVLVNLTSLFFRYSGYIVSNGGWTGKNMKTLIASLSNIFSYHFLGRTEEKQKITQYWYLLWTRSRISNI